VAGPAAGVNVHQQRAERVVVQFGGSVALSVSTAERSSPIVTPSRLIFELMFDTVLPNLRPRQPTASGARHNGSMSGGRLFTGLYWEQGQALATYLDEAGRAYREAIRPGDVVAWRLHGLRRCTGVYNGQTERRRPCPRRAAVRHGGQCASCVSADPGRLIAKDRAAPSGTFRTYLALFGRDTVKVGLTADGRAADRLLEQAAAAHVALCSGPYAGARQAELLLSNGLSLPQHVSWRRKRALWSERSDARHRAETLMVRAERARALLSQQGDAAVLSHEAVVDDATRYGLPGDVLPRRRHVVTGVDDGDLAAGSVLGVLGKLLVLDAAGDCLVLDTRALEGWSLIGQAPGEPSRFATAPVLESSVQQEPLFGS
jgi:hypothetical protein